MPQVRALEDDLDNYKSECDENESWQQRLDDLGLGANLEELKAEIVTGPHDSKEYRFLCEYISVLGSFEGHPDPLAALESLLDRLDVEP